MVTKAGVSRVSDELTRTGHRPDMGLLGNLLSSNVDGVVIELDKEKTPYLVGEKVLRKTFTQS